jgi:hypothetical protein
MYAQAQQELNTSAAAHRDKKPHVHHQALIGSALVQQPAAHGLAQVALVAHLWSNTPTMRLFKHKSGHYVQ